MASSSQGAPRTCRCIETVGEQNGICFETGQGAPRTCRCIETVMATNAATITTPVREHHAPVGALRHDQPEDSRQHLDESGSTTHL